MKIKLICFFIVVAVTNSALAEDRDYLTGDWGGVRSELAENGILIDSILTLDAVANLKGGLKRDEAYLGNVDLTLTVDTEKAGLWSGGTFFAYGLGNFGDTPTEIVGDIQATSNIEAPETFKLYELWYDHAFYDDKLAVLFGLHDYNSEFDVLEYGGSFINSSFGIGPDISQVGPSIFPTTSLAARVRIQSESDFYILAAVYDGIPGDPDNEKGTHIKLSSDDGLFYAFESGLSGGEDDDYYKIAIGSWYHTTDFEDFDGGIRDANNGFYLLGEKRIWSEEDVTQGLGAFARIGVADSDRNQIARYFGFGLSYTGLVPSRDEDIAAVGFAFARNGNEYKDSDPEALGGETAIEANYRIGITPYLAVTPDFQYIVNPGAVKGVDDSFLVGIRVEIAL